MRAIAPGASASTTSVRSRSTRSTSTWPRPDWRCSSTYHLQILHGDLIRHLRRHFGWIGHVQVAGVPDRNEPDIGEVNSVAVFRELDRLGYAGWVGCEYRPADPRPGGTSAGLGWLRRL